MKSLVRILNCLMIPFVLSLILGFSSLAFGQNQPPFSPPSKNQNLSPEFQSLPDKANWEEIMNELENLYMLFPAEEWNDEPMEEYLSDFRDFMQREAPPIPENLMEVKRHLEMAMRQLDEAIRQMPEFPRPDLKGWKFREHHLSDFHSYGFHNLPQGCPYGTFRDDSLVMDTAGKSIKIIRKMIVGRDTLTKEIECIRMSTPNGRVDTLIIFKDGRKTIDSIVWNRSRQRADLRTFRQTPQSWRYSERKPKSRTLYMVDLNSDDLNKLSHSALKPSQVKEPLDLDKLSVNKSVRGKIRLRFTTEQSGDIEVSVFDEQGSILHHEILKKFSGNYDRIITLLPQPVYYLKIQQGKKVLQKKITE